MNAILQKRITEAAKEFDKESSRIIFENGANFILNNLWISVDEALPKEKYLVLTRVKTPVGIVHRSDYYINDYWYMCRYNQEEIVTHWMEIPSLKGGEKCVK